MNFGLLSDFSKTSVEERAEVLYRYLVKGESGAYIAEEYYNNKNYAWKISAITQGYCEKVVKIEVRLIQQNSLFINLYQVIQMGHTNQR